MSDVAAFVEQVQAAFGEQRPLALVAGNTKAFRGRTVDATPLDLSGHAGIIDYEPNELVLTARAGTLLSEVEARLKEQQQMLPFEPPHFGAAATLGGTLACNLSGPRRPWSGSIRDALLGVRLINGRGEHLRFGGKVIKNVAGFDVARLQAGALGAFGVVTEMSFKVLPQPASTVTLVQQLDATAALAQMTQYARQSKPLSGAAWVEGALYLRLSGARSAVAATQAVWGGDALEETTAANFWHALTEQQHEFFQASVPVWRFSINPNAALAPIDGDWLIEWAGAQRWLRGDFDREQLEPLAEAAGGHVSLFRPGADSANADNEVHHSLNPALKALHLRLKAAFDPAGIFNPGRLYSWL